MTVSLRERLCGAILGERLSIRVLANAVGRRSPFLRGRQFSASDTPVAAPRKGRRWCVRRACQKAGDKIQSPGYRDRIGEQRQDQGTAAGAEGSAN